MSSVSPGGPAAPYPPSSPPPQQIIVQPAPSAFGRYGRFLWIALAIAVMVIIGQSASYHSYFSPAGEPQEKFHSLSENAAKKIAVIKVEGPIYDADGFVKKQIDRVREDDDVVAVVLRIDSPGGTVTASDYLYHQLVDLKRDRDLPMVVSMGGVCASGGYYMAMAVGDEQTDVIYAEPSTWTGSIGVVIPHFDFSGLLAEWKVKDDSIASHPYTLMGSATRDLSPEERKEERQLLKELVDESFDRFKEIVLTGRPKLKDDEANLEKATTGRIFSADQARELGLVDKIGFIDAAVERAAALANQSTSNLRCIYYEAPPTSLGMLLGADSQTPPAAQLDLARVLELSAPRLLYLNPAWLPSTLRQMR
jgi:protease-4